MILEMAVQSVFWVRFGFWKGCCGVCSLFSVEQCCFVFFFFPGCCGVGLLSFFFSLAASLATLLLYFQHLIYQKK